MSTNFDSAAAQKKWCVMVYFAADVDLEDAAIADLQQMKAAGSSSEVDLLAQLNPGGPRAIRRYHLQKDTYLEEDLVPTLMEDGEHFINNVNAKQDLIEFVRWCATQSDAEHHALILWGHGQGWKADNPDPCFVPGAGNPRKTLEEQLALIKSNNVTVMRSAPLSLPVTLLNGETGFLSNTDLAEAMSDAKKTFGKNIDILGLDACLMAMAEVCCQVNESVDYFVASEDTVPDESWPYDTILKLLVANPDRVSPEDFARLIVRKFIFDFGEKRKFVTQSICQLGNDKNASLNKFTTAVGRLVATLLAEFKDPETRWAAMIARSQAQSFFLKDYIDLFDYCRLLSINCKSVYVVKACEEVMNALHSSNTDGSSSGVVVDHGTYGYPLKCSFGVSVFFPCVGEVPACYPNLEFCQRTKWHEFLNAFLHSPEGRVAAFEPSDIEWPSVITAKEPSVVLTPVPVANVANVDAATKVTTLTATGVVLESNGNGVKTTQGDVIKTTMGDVIKTTQGDPIKVPRLPSFLLTPDSKPKPIIPPTTPDTEPAVRTKPNGTPGNCGCGQNH